MKVSNRCRRGTEKALKMCKAKLRVQPNLNQKSNLGFAIRKAANISVEIVLRDERSRFREFVNSLPPPPQAHVPILPYNLSGKKTLVLDLDETLVHCSLDPNLQDPTFKIPLNNGATIYGQARPFCLEFLQSIKE